MFDFLSFLRHLFYSSSPITYPFIKNIITQDFCKELILLGFAFINFVLIFEPKNNKCYL